MKRSELEKMTVTDLVDLYNKETGESLKKFENKEKAVERLKKVFRKKQLCTFNKMPHGVARPPRENSKRFKTYEMLKRPEGTTVEEVMEATGWDFETARSGIRCVWSVCHFGLNTDEKGRIRIDAQ